MRKPTNHCSSTRATARRASRSRRIAANLLLVLAAAVMLAACGGGGGGGGGVSGSCALDSDSDGLPNCVEVQGWTVTLAGEEPYDVTSSPTEADTDGDGLTDQEEMAAGTDPRFSDTDWDTLTDEQEVNIYSSNPLAVDSDGDTLRDGQEVNQYHTSPTLADTDGDGSTDDAEVFTTGFNPLIAELPKLQISISTAPFLTMNGEITVGVTATTYEATLQSRTDSESQSAASSTETTMAESESLTVEATYDAPFGGSASASAEANWSSSTTSTNSSAWSAESTSTAQEEYQQTVTNETTETFTSGTINVGFSIVNRGERSVKVDNLKIAVLKRNVFNYNAQPQLITELVPKDGAEASFQIANGASKGPLLATDNAISPFAMRKLLADPRGLEFIVSAFDFTDIDGTLNYNEIAQNTVARTALVMIDYGDGRVDKRMVATSARRDAQGNSTGLTLSEVLGIMGVSFATGAQTRDVGGVPVTRNVLTRVGNVSVDPVKFTMWFVASSAPDAVDPTLDIEDVTIRSRDVVQLIYVRDTDDDGLIDRHELLYGTNIHNADTDGDGASDGAEVAAGTDPLGVVANANALVLTGQVSTLVGDGVGTSRDGKVATAPTGVYARVNGPQWLKYSGGAVYFSDFNGHKVRKIDLAAGTVTTIAGSGTSACPGTDGTGLAASFSFPQDLEVDGNFLYLNDYNCNTIRKIDLTTLAVTTLVPNTKITAFDAALGGVDGPAGQASIWRPVGMAQAGNFLFVSDTNNLLRRIDKTTGYVTTVAGLKQTSGTSAVPGYADGTGSNARFNTPEGMVSDGIYLYVTEKLGNRIRKVRLNTGEVTTLAGDTSAVGPPGATVDAGTGAAVRFNWPQALYFDGPNLWLTDRLSSVVRTVNPITGATVTVSGAAGVPGYAEGTGALYNFPVGITSDGISLYIADGSNNRIRMMQ